MFEKKVANQSGAIYFVFFEKVYFFKFNTVRSPPSRDKIHPIGTKFKLDIMKKKKRWLYISSIKNCYNEFFFIGIQLSKNKFKNKKQKLGEIHLL